MRSASSVGPSGLDLLLGVGASTGDLRVVVGDVGACGGGEVLRFLEVTLDTVVSRRHSIAHLAEQEQPHGERENDEGAKAPDDFFDFGEDRVEVRFGTFLRVFLFLCRLQHTLRGR